MSTIGTFIKTSCEGAQKVFLLNNYCHFFIHEILGASIVTNP